ncbi:MAG: NAD(P)H-hydrate dehydratase [Clostridiales bacterium]|nr:NAD(P)H-hydrate dehydratase [Clostridiales bacterium]
MNKNKMARVVSAAGAREAERAAAGYGLTDDILMESAACALKEAALSLTESSDRICVLCGGGGNGADGLSLARMLHLAGRKVEIVLPHAEKRNPANEARLAACCALGVPEVPLAQWDPDSYAIVFDALFGIGLSREPQGEDREAIERLNAADVFTLSVDIPSGVNADTGEPYGAAVVANETLTFSLCKLGHILGDGRTYCGNLVVADIGIRSGEGAFAVSGDAITLPTRKTVSHKYDYGKVRVIAGSPEMIGASLLAHESVMAALKSGAGLCTLCVPSSLKSAYMARVKEETLCFLPDKDGKVIYDEQALNALFEKTGAILIGPGMGKNEDLAKIILYVAQHFEGTLVLDADGLNAVANDLPALETHTCKLILTPHLGEFERLCAAYVPPLPLDKRVQMLAQKLRAVVAAKSATTVISDGTDVFLNTTGTPALAKGGSGDVLGGMVAAFACRMPPIDAAVTACYHFGKCAEAAEKVYGTESLLASHIIVK